MAKFGNMNPYDAEVPVRDAFDRPKRMNGEIRNTNSKRTWKSTKRWIETRDKLAKGLTALNRSGRLHCGGVRREIEFRSQPLCQSYFTGFPRCRAWQFRIDCVGVQGLHLVEMGYVIASVKVVVDVDLHKFSVLTTKATKCFWKKLIE